MIFLIVCRVYVPTCDVWRSSFSFILRPCQHLLGFCCCFMWANVCEGQIWCGFGFLVFCLFVCVFVFSGISRYVVSRSCGDAWAGLCPTSLFLPSPQITLPCQQMQLTLSAFRECTVRAKSIVESGTCLFLRSSCSFCPEYETGKCPRRVGWQSNMGQNCSW